MGADQGATLRDGSLADIAPTLLALMDLPKPQEMTGVSLIRPAGARPLAAAKAGAQA